MELTPPLRPGETFWRMVNHGEFDASEMSPSPCTILRSEGDTRFIAIPVFPSRVFRHSAVYVGAESSIEATRGVEGQARGCGRLSDSEALRGTSMSKRWLHTTSLTRVRASNATR